MPYPLPTVREIVPESDSINLNRLAEECRYRFDRGCLCSLYVLGIGYSVMEASSTFSVDEDTVCRWKGR